MTHKNYSNILIRMPNWVGDFVMATPLLSALRKAFPKARITVLCKKPLGELIEKDPHIDTTLTFIKPQRATKKLFHRDLTQKIKEKHFDLGILLTNSFSTALELFQGKVKERLGYQGNILRKIFLTKAIPYPKNKKSQHLALTYQELLKAINIAVSEAPTKLYLSDEEKKQAKRFLSDKGIPKEAKIIGINPGAAYGLAKCWPIEYFRKLSEMLLNNSDYYLVFFGDKTQKPLIDTITEGLGSHVVNLAGVTSLRELMGLLSVCDLLLTNDSGPMHMADALGVKVVALFGSTSDIVTGPYNDGIVIHKHASCSPCFKRVCPIDFRCMRSITPEEVYDILQNTLQPSPLRVLLT